jgi:sterol 3beta-glucosyltransferase
MKALVLTLGTRGDVQPFAALARGLARRGHQVVVAAPERFRSLTEGPGVEFSSVDDGPLRVLEDPSAVGDVAGGGLRAKAALMRSMPAMFGRLLDDCWQVASTGAGAGADVVVHNGQVIAGQHVAEKLGVPAVLGLPIPMYVPTRAFPWPGQQFSPSLPGFLNRATFAGMKAPAVVFGRTVDRWRASLGLPRRRGRHDPLRSPDGRQVMVLHGISPSVLPRPGDWPATAQMTGYWFLDSPAGDASLAPRVKELLAADPPPVYVGFGSMAGPDPAAATGVVLEALRLAGVRAVIGTGWGGLPETVSQGHVFASELPHDVVFPRCSVIVHHGGAGTTAAAARAGRPQVICPFVADQPFWGRRMQHLGVAPAPIDQRRLTAESLAAAIRQALTPSMARTAEGIGERIRAEDGITTAVAALEDALIRSGR